MHALIGRIYDAATGSGSWSDAISAITDATRCISGLLYEHDVATGRSHPLGFCRQDPAAMREYEAYYAPLDPWNKRILGQPVGLVGTTYALISDADLRRTEFYQDYLRRTGIFYGMGTVVGRPSGRMAVFGVQCDYQAGHFSDRDMSLVRHMIPHLRRAYRIQLALSEERRRTEMFEDVLHALEKPVLIVEPDGRLVFANAAAAVLLRERDGVQVQAGIVSAAHAGDRVALATALGPMPTDAAPAAVRLRRPGKAQPLVAVAVPLRRPNGQEWSGRVALLIDGAVARGRKDVEVKAEAFRLTQAEIRLWNGLASGATLSEIAERTAVSKNTLRVQLAHLFNKVGVHRQADLVRRAMELREAPDDGSDPSR